MKIEVTAKLKYISQQTRLIKLFIRYNKM